MTEREIEQRQAETLGAEIMDTIADICRRHGVVVDMSTPVYSPVTGWLTLNARAKLRKAKVAVIDNERELFRQHAVQFGLEPHWYNTSLVIGTMRYTIIGINPARPGRAVVIRDRRGKVWTTSPQIVNSILRADPGNIVPFNNGDVVK